MKTAIPLKTVEFAPLIYFLLTGALFVFKPDTLSNPAYAGWATMTTSEWGVLLLTITTVHSAALYWNGRSPVKSRVARAAALIGYLWVSLEFGRMFIESGIPWGAILFWVLLPLLCGSLFVRITDEVKILQGRW